MKIFAFDCLNGDKIVITQTSDSSHVEINMEGADFVDLNKQQLYNLIEHLRIVHNQLK